MKPQQWIRFKTFLASSKAQIWLLYGASECNGALGCYLTSMNDVSIPMGNPLPDVSCLLIDEQSQVISRTNNENAIGQIYIGG